MFIVMVATISVVAMSWLTIVDSAVSHVEVRCFVDLFDPPRPPSYADLIAIK